MTTRTVLITGVAGLLGARLADWIIATHPEVTVVGVDDLSGGFRNNVHPQVDFHELDVVSSELDALFVRWRPDVVFHFAAYAAECLSPFIRRYNYHNNVVATANVVNCCIKYNVNRLVFASSMAVYGSGTPPFKETDNLAPVDPYGVAKFACETDIQIAGEQHGLDWCILRPHNVYGAKQNIWDPYRNVLGIFMYKALVGDPLTVYGDGQQRRAFSCIDDTLEPMWKAGIDPRASRQVINLGGTKESTIFEAVTAVINGAKAEGIQLPREPTHITLPSRYEVRYAFSTYQRSVDLLDFEHRIDLDEGVRRMWRWAAAQPKHPRQTWQSYELDRGLYPYWQQEALQDGYWLAAVQEQLTQENHS